MAEASDIAAKRAPKIGMVSLGCPKALVDSERILTRLKGEGYDTSADYAGSDAVIVNTCAFLDSAREESLDAIAEARRSGRPVIVTGCMGSEEALLRERFPDLAAVTGAQAYDAVLDAVHRTAPQPDPFADIAAMPGGGIKLTPRHYAYLKISEGCDHRCSFCIIPSLRGDLASRPVDDVLREAEALVSSGVKELLVVSQDTSAYGLDIRYAPGEWRGQQWKANLEGLARGLGELGVWVRLHYIYPYPHVDAVIPLMAEGKILPYLDIPFQHAAPNVLKAMKRPGNQEKTLERIGRWREIAPDLAIRSTFVVGFPGETEADFDYLMQWLEEAQLDRVGCFAYENVKGAAARDLPDHVPEEVKQDRRQRFMAAAEKISRAKLRAKVGKRIKVLVDEVRADGTAIARTMADAPEIDGRVLVRGAAKLSAGDFAEITVERADAFDLVGRLGEATLNRAPLAPARRMHRVISRV
ncbi:30S ribosomal protein S12 methylthiotransferase RimO [Caulobacter sp. S45]|uniref:30S ribosomal protein S12 methylthiotransferase RimO n=1 Tax=Caulobacter sp. S45 TaxID=1641861 RepID=UPI00131ADE53|nr:30S ribosomal protein S12 methylthiotransferase RimO [Caulobacter sp. S45]